MNTSNNDFLTQVGKIMVMVIAVIVAIWVAFFLIRLLGTIFSILIPLVLIGGLIWFGYKILMSKDPRVN
jgi:hypothetical protein